MKAKYWIILGVVGVVVGLILPAIVAGYWINQVSSTGPFSGAIVRDEPYYLITVGIIGQILFWCGLILAAFGLVKYYKEK